MADKVKRYRLIRTKEVQFELKKLKEGEYYYVLVSFFYYEQEYGKSYHFATEKERDKVFESFTSAQCKELYYDTISTLN